MNVEHEWKIDRSLSNRNRTVFLREDLPTDTGVTRFWRKTLRAGRTLTDTLGDLEVIDSFPGGFPKRIRSFNEEGLNLARYSLYDTVDDGTTREVTCWKAPDYGSFDVILALPQQGFGYSRAIYSKEGSIKTLLVVFTSQSKVDESFSLDRQDNLQRFATVMSAFQFNGVDVFVGKESLDDADFHMALLRASIRRKNWTDEEIEMARLVIDVFNRLAKSFLETRNQSIPEEDQEEFFEQLTMEIIARLPDGFPNMDMVTRFKAVTQGLSFVINTATQKYFKNLAEAGSFSVEFDFLEDLPEELKLIVMDEKETLSEQGIRLGEEYTYDFFTYAIDYAGDNLLSLTVQDTREPAKRFRIIFDRLVDIDQFLKRASIDEREGWENALQPIYNRFNG